ncbi:MAG: hypothetical protein J6X47_08345, partial [Clostridia bacterium]|nr:hypothetical protein [Clostridia bacterium]
MKLSDFARETIKNHAKGVARILMIHMLAVALGWAAFPLILMIFARYTTTDVPMAVFSVVAMKKAPPLAKNQIPLILNLINL